MATYEEVKDIPNHPQKYLIDVRNAAEIAKSGAIPGSINIPLPELKKVLSGDASQFKSKYSRDMPPKDAVIIFSCKSGVRATNAAAIAKELGFPKFVSIQYFVYGVEIKKLHFQYQGVSGFLGRVVTEIEKMNVGPIDHDPPPQHLAQLYIVYTPQKPAAS